MKWGLKGGISIDADSGPPRYVLWCCGRICHQVLTFIQIGCGHTVKVSRSRNMKPKIYEILSSPKIQTNGVILINCIDYRTRAIITRSLYTFYPLFEDHFFVFKEVFFEKFCHYVWLNSIQERVVMARLRYSR